MSIRTFLIKILEGDKMSDQSVIQPPVSSVVVQPTVAEQAAADTSVDTSASTVVSDASADVASENAPVATTATSVDTDELKAALTVAGKDVESYWDVVVAYGKKIDTDVVAGIKKALTYLESEAVEVYDEAVALVKAKV